MSRCARWGAALLVLSLSFSCAFDRALTVKTSSSGDPLLRNAVSFRIQQTSTPLVEDPLWSAREKDLQDRARIFFESRGLRAGGTAPDLLVILHINLASKGGQLYPRLSMVVARFHLPIGYASPIWSGYAEQRVAASDARLSDYYGGLLGALLSRYPR